jgi:NADPH:quinone reductase-like Zn-dependent oxidoreductase
VATGIKRRRPLPVRPIQQFEIQMTTVVRFHELGGPDVLRLESLDVPPPGASEVKIRVEAIGLNRAELAFRAGRYLERPKLPSRLGYEASGTVISVGDAVRAFTPGQRVGVIPAFSQTDYGTYGEEILVPAHAVVSCPSDISSVTFAAIWMQYLTAYGGLVEAGSLQSGEHVLITAASSSVGIASIELALAIGATPIAATRTGAKREALRRAGAAHVVATQEQDLVSEVRAITGGKGVRLVFDPVAGPFVETLAKATTPGGMIIIYGGLSAQPTPFPGGIAMVKGLAIRGYTLFEMTRVPARLTKAKDFIFDGVQSGKFAPVIDRTFHLQDIADAHRYMEASEHVGKIVVTVP